MPTRFCPLSSVPGVRRERRKEARPGELLAAALQLFVEKGFAATRAEEVARLAGVSKGTLFLYFASKEDLFKAVVRENLSGQFPEWNARFEAYEGSTPDLVRLFLFQWWETVGNSPISGIIKLMTSEASNFPELAAFYEQEVIEPGRRLIERILQRGITNGEFAPLDLRYGVYTLLAPMLFLATWKHSFGACTQFADTIDPQEYLRVQSEIILRGLAAAPNT
ncbi:TetR/AcrR family transcriptional regulator [Curvibacter sp. APW13]|uniref:TetR/AcrR family transcriptional regulator n=1 Tax=Curvibacter sp. APW13 TaxID=3077236 RepID=UPI0028E072FA|nr:TetR/AcrR family transcriptional regulator [Curvibacter sp. APW13]MDT8991840.1 TetR/AcrR family transcriptional regulator [Curvibacter sp. APW13]